MLQQGNLLFAASAPQGGLDGCEQREELRTILKEELQSALENNQEALLQSWREWSSKQEDMLEKLTEAIGRPRLPAPTWLRADAPAADKEAQKLRRQPTRNMLSDPFMSPQVSRGDGRLGGPPPEASRDTQRASRIGLTDIFTSEASRGEGRMAGRPSDGRRKSSPDVRRPSLGLPDLRRPDFAADARRPSLGGEAASRPRRPSLPTMPERGASSEESPLWDNTGGDLERREFGEGGASPVSTLATRKSGAIDMRSDGSGLKASQKPSRIKQDFDTSEQARRGAALTKMPRMMRSGTLRFDRQAVIRRLARKLVGLACFDQLFMCLIVLSSVVVGLEVQASVADWGDDIQEAFTITQYTFTGVFFVEVVLRITASGRSFFYKKGCGWNYFDLIIVSLSVMDNVFEIASTAKSNMPTVSTIRTARFIRLVRLVRVIRLVKFCRALRILVHSILNTLAQLMYAVLLLLLIMYSFAIIFTQGVAETPPDQRDPVLEFYFGSLDVAIFTLFRCIAGGTQWDQVIAPLGDASMLQGGLFVTYIVFAVFAVLNVMTAHFCNSALESASKDEEEVIQTQLANITEYSNKLRALFSELDPEGSGEVTLASFERFMQDPRLKAYCHTLDIDVPDAWTLFKLLDTDQRHSVDLEAFVQGCLKIRGVARTMIVKEMMYELRWTYAQFQQHMEYVSGELDRLADQQDELHDSIATLHALGTSPAPPLGRRASWSGSPGQPLANGRQLSQLPQYEVAPAPFELPERAPRRRASTGSEGGTPATSSRDCLVAAKKKQAQVSL